MEPPQKGKAAMKRKSDYAALKVANKRNTAVKRPEGRHALGTEKRGDGKGLTIER